MFARIEYMARKSFSAKNGRKLIVFARKSILVNGSHLKCGMKSSVQRFLVPDQSPPSFGKKDLNTMNFDALGLNCSKVHSFSRKPQQLQYRKDLSPTDLEKFMVLVDEKSIKHWLRELLRAKTF